MLPFVQKINIKFILLIFFSLFYSKNILAQKELVKFNPNNPYHKVYIPTGKGPFPAVLLLHASGGVENVNYKWAELLQQEGYYVFIVDSFTPRGYVDRKSIGWEKATAAQFSDIEPAYNYLATIPFIDKSKIGILGFSMGGYDVLRAMQSNIPFKAAASFYGVCKLIDYKIKLKGPLKIFIGQEDDRATRADCENLIHKEQIINNSVFIQTYANSAHGFDNPELTTMRELEDEKGEKYHVGYNEKAGNAARCDLLKFFKKYLKK